MAEINRDCNSPKETMKYFRIVYICNGYKHTTYAWAESVNTVIAMHDAKHPNDELVSLEKISKADCIKEMAEWKRIFKEVAKQAWKSDITLHGRKRRMRNA